MSMAFLERRRQSFAGAASWSAGAAGACSRERPRVSDAGAEGHVGLCMRWSGGIACHRISQLRYLAGANQTDRDGNDPAVKYAPACDTLKAPLGRRASSAIEKMQPERASVTIDVDISNRPRDWATLPLSVPIGRAPV